MDTKRKQATAERVRRLATKLLREHGLERTRPSFWTRPREYAVEFVHLHLYTFAPAFRVHVGIRVLQDPFEAPALNGPDSHGSGWSARLEFSDSDNDVRRCAEAIARYCVEVGEPWWARWRSLATLLSDRSPVGAEARAALQQALAGNDSPLQVAQSMKLLGLSASAPPNQALQPTWGPDDGAV